MIPRPQFPSRVHERHIKSRHTHGQGKVGNTNKQINSGYHPSPSIHTSIAGAERKKKAKKQGSKQKKPSQERKRKKSGYKKRGGKGKQEKKTRKS
jgi:hypothetical protein